jgi:ABC-type nickel/cobalt efflux system permease component RcnA
VLLVAAISAGMAVAMSSLGIVAILFRQLVEKRLEASESRQRRFTAGVRIAGAACVLLIGLLLFSLTLSGNNVGLSHVVAK